MEPDAAKLAAWAAYDPTIEEIFDPETVYFAGFEAGLASPSEEKSPEWLAKTFHDAYELLAPRFGYKTREASAVPWEQVPKDNKRLMIATCELVIAALAKREGK